MEATVYFVIPCYNEEAVLPETTRRMTDKLNAMRAAGLIGEKSRILYVMTAARTEPGSWSPNSTGKTPG